MSLRKVIRLSVVVLCTLLVPEKAGAQDPGLGHMELIVLLMPDSVDPEAVVASVNQRSASGAFAEGDPVAARMVEADPPGPRLAEWISHNPDTPEGRARRWLVLRYVDEASRTTAMSALEADLNVEGVGENLAFELHGASGVLPNDPWLGEPGDDPLLTQWAFHALNLGEGNLGTAYVGIIDEGLDVDHLDLVGSFRPHNSRDVSSTPTDCSVDELDPTNPPGNFDSTPGHGSHVAGLVGATSNNGIGIAGACDNCSLLIVKASPAPVNSEPPPQQIVFDRVFAAIDFLRGRGAQVVNMSFGVEQLGTSCDNPEGPLVELQVICDGLALAEARDIAMVASAGNNSRPFIDFPARDPRTIAVGGLELDPVLGPVIWDDGCFPGCGSNFSLDVDLMAGSKSCLSTVYPGQNHLMSGTCGDDNFTLDAPAGGLGGWGLCTGTSMSSPLVSGLTGRIRTPNPQLSKEGVKDVITSTASIPGVKAPQLGHGQPDAGAAGLRAHGQVRGQQLANRLKPLFAFHSPPLLTAPRAETHVNTTVPQFGSALLLDDVRLFNTVGPPTPPYGAFPQFCTTPAVDCCPVSQPCCVGQGSQCVAKILAAEGTRPRASVYVFSSDAPPAPNSPSLAALYRLRYESALTDACQSPQNDPISPVRDFALATSTAEVEAYLGGVNLGGTIFKYKLDGIEGFVYEHCDSGCPPGVVALHRLYSSARHDTVVVPASEVAAMNALGYLPPTDPALPEIVGFALPNVDSDSDGLVDAWERLLGTGVNDADSDDDGVSDGEELLVYDRSSPDPALRGYGDPCSNGCPIFTDGFESGNTSRWSSTAP